MSNWAYVGLAYGITYIVLVGYVVSLVRRYRQVDLALKERSK
jgi:heme exporter protein CcmD